MEKKNKLVVNVQATDKDGKPVAGSVKKEQQQTEKEAIDSDPNNLPEIWTIY